MILEKHILWTSINQLQMLNRFIYYLLQILIMQRQSIDIPNKLYDQIIQLKKNQSVEQFLSELIGRYSSERNLNTKEELQINRRSEVLSIKDKFDFVNKDQNLSKFKSHKN